MAQFIPRTVFPPQLSLPRSYFLGHHASGLSKMKTMLSHIDVIIECRDYRVPLTSRNPLFEQLLIGRERLVVFTKMDLGRESLRGVTKQEKLISNFHAPTLTMFTSHTTKTTIKPILTHLKSLPANSLLGTRVLVVGMPNVGKSSLLNALRWHGVHKTKAAHTGAQPGITRKISSGVKIAEKEVGGSEGIYIVDTPGVFVPFVPDSEAMLKLALVGSVKDTIIAPVTLCDYLLFCLNQQYGGPMQYAEYCEPTNDVQEFLEAVCRKSGRLGKGGVPDLDAAALWIIQRWRQGHLGKFILDDVSDENMEKNLLGDASGPVSLSQARKVAKDVQRAKGKSRMSGKS